MALAVEPRAPAKCQPALAAQMPALAWHCGSMRTDQKFRWHGVLPRVVCCDRLTHHARWGCSHSRRCHRGHSLSFRSCTRARVPGAPGMARVGL